MGRIDKLVKTYNRMKTLKDKWNSPFDFIAEFYEQKTTGYKDKDSGPFVNFEDDNYTSQPPKMVSKAASAFMAHVFSSPEESLRVSASNATEKIENSGDFYKMMSDTLHAALNDPESGFQRAKSAVFQTTQSYGTCGMHIEGGEEIGSLKTEAWTVKNLYIDRDSKGLVRRAAYELCAPVEDLAEIYGEEKLSPEMRECLRDGDFFKEFTVVHMIQRNWQFDIDKPMVKSNMPYSSDHFSVTCKHLIKESGYFENPAPVVSPFLLEGETYGRSPALDVAADTYNFNVINSKFLEYLCRSLRRPIVYDTNAIQTDTIDDSEGGMTPADFSKLNGQPPFMTLYDFQDISALVPLRENILGELNEAFSLDRLLDFNSGPQMTLGEANIRRVIRSEGIAMPSIEYLKFFHAVGVRCISVLYRQGAFGINEYDKEMTERLQVENPNYEFKQIPSEIAKKIYDGEEWYTLEFLTPAARSLEEQGFSTALEFIGVAGQMSQFDQTIMDNFDGDKLIRSMYLKRGLPTEGLRSEEDRNKIRQARIEAQKRQADLANAQATGRELPPETAQDQGATKGAMEVLGLNG